ARRGGPGDRGPGAGEPGDRRRLSERRRRPRDHGWPTAVGYRPRRDRAARRWPRRGAARSSQRLIDSTSLGPVHAPHRRARGRALHLEHPMNDVFAAVGRPPAAVLWDMDGTIVDTETHWIDAAEEIARAHGLQPSADALTGLVGASLTDGAQLMRRWGVDLPVTDLVERHLELAMRNTAAAGLRWRPGAVELLAALRVAGIPLALVTMSYRRYAAGIVSALPAGTFDVIVAGDDV